ncbi:MAG: AAA family ATPase [Magnetococcales bacterium]|nr:AAA family ATPase [Magnetococcales bacterium]
MQVISFYSFKGGVGRTNALLNVAWILAKRKYFVAVVDMDLHAPGLTLMPDMAPSPEWSGHTFGLIDFLEDVFNQYTDTLLDLKALTYRPRLVPLKSKDFQGDLLFLPCSHMGTPEKDELYRSKLRRLPLNILNELRTSGRNTALIQEIRDQLANLQSDRLPGRPLDFLFLDARTGFTEIGDMIIGKGSDHVVALLSLNEQNRRGLGILLSELINEKDYPINELPGRLSILVGPVPDGEEALKRAAMERIEQTLHQFARLDTSLNTKEVMPEIIPISYHPILALTEQIISRDFPDARPSQAYQRLADEMEKRVMSSSASSQRIIAETQANLADLLPPEEKQNEQMFVEGSQQPVRHPYGVVIPWNLLCRDKRWQNLLSDFPKESRLDPDPFLNLLATSGQSIEDKRKILNVLSSYDGDQINRLINVLQKEREDFLKLTEKQWDDLSFQLGERWQEWLDLLKEHGLQIDYPLMVNIRPIIISDLIFWFSWANKLIETNRLDESREILEICVRLFPEFGWSHLFLGDVLCQSDRFNESRQAFADADKIFEKNEDSNGHILVLTMQARLAFAEGNKPLARETFQRAKTLADDEGLILQARKLSEMIARHFPN